MARWIRIADVAECPAGSAVERLAGDRIVALFHVGDQWYALDGICPHQGGPLAQGELSGCVITCPWHGWQFDVAEGSRLPHGNLRQPRFPVRIEGADVFVDLDP